MNKIMVGFRMMDDKLLRWVKVCGMAL